jgi:hypothetical protein
MVAEFRDRFYATLARSHIATTAAPPAMVAVEARMWKEACLAKPPFPFRRFEASPLALWHRYPFTPPAQPSCFNAGRRARELIVKKA